MIAIITEITIDFVQDLLVELYGNAHILMVSGISNTSKNVVFEDYLSKVLTQPITQEELNDFIWENRDEIAHCLGFVDAYEMIENESDLLNSTNTRIEGFIDDLIDYNSPNI